MAYALHRATLQTPVGTVIVESDAAAVIGVSIAPADMPTASSVAPANSPAGRAIGQLADYFEGRRRMFDIPLSPATTPRGMALRAGIAAIPYAATQSYGALAATLGSAARAVGQACRRNPFPIIIPCHRVTSTSGPEFYSGGDGPATKAWLIAFERRMLTQP